MAIRKNFPWYAVLFLFAFEFALLGLNPTFYMDDSPEFTTVANTFGIAHPPGYPLYVLLGRLMAFLPLPPCFRINLLPALLASVVCLLLFSILDREFHLPKSIGFVFSFLWMAGATSYPAALSAKRGIYELTAVFLLAILMQLLRGRFLAALFLFGVSLSGHWMSMVSYVPGFALLYFLRGRIKRPPVMDGSRLMLSVSLILIGLSVYLYLPLRSVNGPLINWGRPDDWTLFLQHISRHVDAGRDFASNPGLWIRSLGFYCVSAFWEFLGVGCLALIGLAVSWRANRGVTLGMGLSWFGLIAAVCVFSKFSGEKPYLLQDYSISSMTFVLLFSAVGAGSLLTLLRGRKPHSVVVQVLVLSMGIAVAGFRWSHSNESNYTYSYDYVLNCWKELPKGAVFFCSGDVLQFPGWYLQEIADKRPDLCIVGSGMTMDWNRILLAKSHPGLAVPFPKNEPGKAYLFGPLSGWLSRSNPDRPQFISYVPSPSEGFENPDLIPYGLVYEIGLPGRKVEFQAGINDSFWRSVRLRNIGPSNPAIDERTRTYLLDNYADARIALAMREFKMAFPTSGESSYWIKKCLNDMSWAYHWDPANPSYAINVGAVYFFAGDMPKAREWIGKAMKKTPSDSDIYYDAGVLAYQSKEIQEAVKCFREGLASDPSNFRARHALETLGFPRSD